MLTHVLFIIFAAIVPTISTPPTVPQLITSSCSVNGQWACSSDKSQLLECTYISTTALGYLLIHSYGNGTFCSIEPAVGCVEETETTETTILSNQSSASCWEQTKPGAIDMTTITSTTISTPTSTFINFSSITYTLNSTVDSPTDPFTIIATTASITPTASSIIASTDAITSEVYFSTSAYTTASITTSTTKLTIPLTTFISTSTATSKTELTTTNMFTPTSSEPAST
ncbi:hypothetical protein HK100_009507 [Physocladia obscura]|uniref:Uncharacterized protein n=1 Tax=Physocladia obscura TaxID=109957 RepID=A0AAD5TAP5_9FUNG|nr:hypothetical protein HK100_009507 [Physocladia obscura]